MTVKEALDNMALFLGAQGLDPDSEQALFYLNRARRVVYPLDDWVHTISYGCIYVKDCSFVLPEECDSIRAAWQFNKPIEIANEYFDSVSKEYVIKNAGCELKFFRSGRTMKVPFIPDCSLLSFQAEDSDDAGKEVSIAYYNKSGSIITEKIKLQDDFQLTETEDFVKSIISISKDRTKGKVSISSGGTIKYRMSPRFTSGRFEEYKVDGNIDPCEPVLLKCKIRFRDYTKDDYEEMLDIESIDALEFAAMAIHAKAQGELPNYQAYLLTARTHLEVAKENLESSSKGYETMRLPSNTQRDERCYY